MLPPSLQTPFPSWIKDLNGKVFSLKWLLAVEIEGLAESAVVPNWRTKVAVLIQHCGIAIITLRVLCSEANAVCNHDHAQPICD